MIVHAGDLSSISLARAREELAHRGILERVVHLPQNSMVGRLVTTTLLVLSEGNSSVLVTNLRGTDPADPGLASLLSEGAGFAK